jgi:hypothetical protein
VASDATVYSELQGQAAKLGADAVLVVSGGMKQYGSFPGIATYNANGNLYGNNALVGGRYQAAGVAIAPHSYVGLNVQGIALKRISAPSKNQWRRNSIYDPKWRRPVSCSISVSPWIN